MVAGVEALGGSEQDGCPVVEGANPPPAVVDPPPEICCVVGATGQRDK